MILDIITEIGSSASIGQVELFILPNCEAVDATLRNSHEELFVAGRGDVG